MAFAVCLLKFEYGIAYLFDDGADTVKLYRKGELEPMLSEATAKKTES